MANKNVTDHNINLELQQPYARIDVNKCRNKLKLIEEIDRVRDRLKAPLELSNDPDREWFDKFSRDGKATNQTVEAAREALANLQQRATRLGTENDDLKKRVTELQRQIEASTLSTEQLQHEHDALAKERDRQADQSRKQADDRTTLEAFYNRLLEGKGGDNATLTATNASLVSQVQELQRKITEQEGQLEIQEEAGIRHADVNTKLQAQVLELKAKHDKLKAKRNAALTAKDDLVQQLADCTAARDHNAKQLAQCLGEKNNISEELDECNSAKDLVAAQLEDCYAELPRCLEDLTLKKKYRHKLVEANDIIEGLTQLLKSKGIPYHHIFDNFEDSEDEREDGN